VVKADCAAEGGRYGACRTEKIRGSTILFVQFGKIALSLIAAALFLGTVVACSPLAALNTLTPSGAYYRAEDISYGPYPRNQLDIYTPVTLKDGELAPVVVFFYGGNWNSGSRSDYEFIGEALASHGIVTVMADYRLYPQVRYPEFLEDSARAVAWTAREIQRYGGDPTRLYVMGHSAGAYNAAMIALDPRWLALYGMTPAILNGWIGLAGPYDFLPITNEATRPVFFYPDTPPSSQPINHVTGNAPPALLIAPNKDAVVNPVRNTGGLARRLREADVPVTEIYFDNVSHATLIAAMSRPLRGLAPVLDTVVRFVAITSSDGRRR
jgi:acetyl esterase/lipase